MRLARDLRLVCPCLVVEVSPRSPRLDPDRPPHEVEPHPAHPREVDDDAAVAVPKPARLCAPRRATRARARTQPLRTPTTPEQRAIALDRCRSPRSRPGAPLVRGEHELPSEHGSEALERRSLHRARPSTSAAGALPARGQARRGCRPAVRGRGPSRSRSCPGKPRSSSRSRPLRHTGRGRAAFRREG
jgi:hypothetical protein